MEEQDDEKSSKAQEPEFKVTDKNEASIDYQREE